MSDKNTRHAGQAEEQPLEQSSALPELDHEGSPSFGTGEDLPSPTELLNDLLAGLEGEIQGSESAAHEADSANVGSSADQMAAAAVDATTEQPVEEQAQNLSDADEDVNVSEQSPDPIDAEEASEAAADSAQEDDDDEAAELPPVTETALTVAPNGSHETDGMTLIERAQYHARMRRREQTRLRRENAKRGASGAEVPYQAMSPIDMRFTLIRLAIAAIFLIFGVFLRQTGVGFVFYLIAYLITVLPIVGTVAHHFTHGKYFDEYLLILIASLGAFLLGNRPEASAILILHDVGKIVSDLVLASTHKSLTKQTDFIPDRASVVNMQGEERQVTPSEIKKGDFVLVRSGERIPIDGIVLRGEGTVDDTVLTGENEPVPVSKNAKVLAGSLYTGSLLLLRAVARFEDCAVNQILRVQEEGKEKKAALEDSVAHGAARIIPVIIVLAVLLSIIPPLFNSGTSMANWIYRALTILVVCCPTALAVSVPLCFFVRQRSINAKGHSCKRQRGH